MNRFIVIVIMLACFKAVGQSLGSKVFWSSGQPLEWSDFQSIPDTLSLKTEDGFADAAASVGIESIKIDSLHDRSCYKLKAAFYCFESWHTKSGYVLLKHEQGHFDLMEVSVRKLKKRLIEYSATCESVNVNTEIGLEYVWYDSINDQSTSFGGFPMAQEMWNDRISTELSKYKDYSEDMIICVCE